MDKRLTLSFWLEGAEDSEYQAYLRARSKSRTLADPGGYLEAITAERIGALPRWVRMVLTYMRDIEAGVWRVYFDELVGTPTGLNPAVRAFLHDWLADENHHAAIIRRILEVSGGAIETEKLTPANMTWVAWLFGERVFGGVHMTIGSVNELMARFAYARLADLIRRDHPELASILRDISSDESYHFSFYNKNASRYLGASRVSRMLTRIVSRFAVRGVGVGVRSAKDAHEVFRILLRGVEDEFLARVQDPIRKLPGQSGFRAMDTLLESVFAG